MAWTLPEKRSRRLLWALYIAVLRLARRVAPPVQQEHGVAGAACPFPTWPSSPTCSATARRSRRASTSRPGKCERASSAARREQLQRVAAGAAARLPGARLAHRRPRRPVGAVEHGAARGDPALDVAHRAQRHAWHGAPRAERLARPGGCWRTSASSSGAPAAASTMLWLHGIRKLRLCSEPAPPAPYAMMQPCC